MSNQYTRKELYDLVWSTPILKLAEKLKVSNTAIAKACKKADIPRPPRGYWAKLEAGKTVTKVALPPRGIGMFDEITIGKRTYGSSYIDDEGFKKQVILPPVFEKEIELIREEISVLVGKVIMPAFPSRAHRHIKKLLADDELRREKISGSDWMYAWDKPKFDDPFEKRRLRILNAILTKIEQLGFSTHPIGKEGRNLSVHINDTNVSFELDATSQKSNTYGDASVMTRGNSTKMFLKIKSWHSKEIKLPYWEDKEDDKIENYLSEIVTELILMGEQNYRSSQMHSYKWQVERKERLIEEARIKKEQEAEEKRQKIAEYKKAQLDKLKSHANDFQQAEDIRSFVLKVTELYNEDKIPASDSDFQRWKEWALSQAESIDPILSGKFTADFQDGEGE